MAKIDTANVTPATSLRGTPAQLVKAGVTLNGRPITDGIFAFLRKYHYDTAIKMAGYADKPAGQKGKALEMVELLNTENFKFELGKVSEVTE